jgi:hypothetical protein
MQFFHLHENRYLICLKKKYTWGFFRKRVKVSADTYSGIFAKRLYSSVFEFTDDLNQEYRKYYKDEYANIYEFMFWRYGISDEIYREIPNATDRYLAVLEAEWQLEDDNLLKDTFIVVFTELDK